MLSTWSHACQPFVIPSPSSNVHELYPWAGVSGFLLVVCLIFNLHHVCDITLVQNIYLPEKYMINIASTTDTY
jgi:hypothetical protein